MKLIAAIWLKMTGTPLPAKARFPISRTCALGVICLCPTVFAAPDPGVTNGNAVFFSGDQSQGVILDVSSTSPATLVVSNLNLNSSITPASGVSGVQIGGQDTTRNLTAILDGTVNITTTGDNASGVVAQNAGGDAGSVQLPPPNFTLTNFLQNGTNFIITGSFGLNTNSYIATNKVVNGTNTVVIVTNLGSGPGFAHLVPAGGVTVINQSHITTSGNNAHGILAESLPGTISITSLGVTTPGVPYGDAGPVTVFNSGDITTTGDGSHGIFAQSLGGVGPEDSPTSGNGSVVSVQTSGGNIITHGNGSVGIFAQSLGGNNTGGESGGTAGDGDDGGTGGDGGQVFVTGTGNITTYSNNSQGIFALSQAGNGGNGGNGGTLGGSGGSGASGGKGSSVMINGAWNIETYGTNSSGIVAQSLGGRGGDGGDGSHFIDLGGGNGGGTGDGGTVAVTSGGDIHTRGADSLGIFARSLGGFAGNGGNSYNPFYGDAGDGNSAGAGQDVAVTNSGSITTEGDLSQAIYAESVGGGGGAAGSSGALVALGSSGGAGGNAGNVTVTNSGALLTFGNGSSGIEAQSLGGGGGDGGSAGGLVSLGGSGSIASTSQVVTVYNSGSITTYGSNSYAILAQSIGGGGGSAGNAAGAVGLGATGGGGGDGAAVHVFNTGALQATGTNSFGIFAQSIGGGGGNGGNGYGLAGIGGSGGSSSKGDAVTVYNSGSIFSSADSIFAQSIGGGGGNGGNGGGWFALGGSGNGGGNAGMVTVNNFGNLATTQTNASALFAQSVGGGGGNGGDSVALGAGASLAIGGSGAIGGNGGAVSVTSGTNFISTLRDNSYGIDAESVGGGGGNGGFAVSVALGKDASAAIALGGSAGGGGSASNVTVSSASSITTSGTNSHGIFAQSVGGGGGAGGFAIAVSGSDTASLSLAMGGAGGSGGNGGNVNVTSTGDILTTNEHAYGILAQSVGGGGGDGGFAIAGSISSGSGVSASLAFGGTGATGGVSKAVGLLNDGSITTMGDNSVAILAQSVGGGGGSGGLSVAGSYGGGAIGASFGGSGGGAGGADMVSLVNNGNLTTFGNSSDGIIAQSVGGGGGAGGLSVAGDIGKSADLGLSFGGSGGTGGSAGAVTLTNSGIIMTHGADSRGIFAQSLGGGGGAGGMSVAAGIGAGGTTLNAALAFGGSATTGGVASAVFVVNTGMIETFGTNADGILAQSIGGGGGAGGLAVAGTLPLGTNSAQVSVALGGNGGEGNTSGSATVVNTQQIVTHGNDSMGIFAQSVGGGGGDGGMSFAGALSRGTASTTTLAIGGNGGTGGDASSVVVDNTGNIFTDGDRSHGILAQSIGGGGGNGGLAAALDFSLGTSNGTVTQFAISVGGSGGAGGVGGSVLVSGSNSIVTTGQDAYGVFAQSVGGGGGSGGMSIAATVVLGASQGTNRALTFAIGGDGGNGNNGGTVTLNRSGAIETFGDGSYGIMAQSVGGGGGDGGSARSFSLFTRGGGGSGGGAEEGTGSKSKSINISIGGDGGTNGSGGMVTLTNVGDITTHGADAYGIFAQSIGGGGGDGGATHSSTDDLIPTSIPGVDDVVNKVISGDSDSYQVVVGGKGGDSGDGHQVIVNDTGNITTWEPGSYGIFAQSVGGGGGAGGLGGLGNDGLLGIGGQGGSSGNGGEVDVTHVGDIVTFGDASTAIFVQSVGGGGGVAGNVDTGLTDDILNVGKGYAFGNDGGAGGNGGTVNVNSTGDITTGGNGADGIFAQSVGGGGGLVGDLGGNIISTTFLTDFAGSVGNVGSGGDVNVSHNGDITTYGTNSTGIFAQSAGGTNGVGGNVNVTLTGSIHANGVNSDGIYAQSGGGATVVTAPIPSGPQPQDVIISSDQPLVNGNVMVTVSSNSYVQGGTGNAVGVRFMDGVNNTLNNHGTVTTVGGLTGTAVSGTVGNDQINNFGWVVGSVDLGAGGNSFINEAHGYIFAGDHINLGAGNLLANEGTILLGDVNHLQTSTLNGDFLQTSNGLLLVKLASPTSYDVLNVNGNAWLDGNVSVSRFNGYLPAKGAAFTFLTASNISGQFASFYDPLKGNYALKLDEIDTPTNVTFQVVQDSFTQFGHTGNQRSIAKALNSVAGVGTTGGNSRAANLVTFMDGQSAEQLMADFQLLAPDELGSMFDLDFASVNLVNNDIQQRMSAIRAGNRDASGGLSYVDNRGNVIQLASINNSLPPMHTVKTQDDWGIFVNGNGQYVDVNGSTNASGYHFHSIGITVGADKMVTRDIAVGFTLDYTGTKASLVDDGSVDTDSGGLGMYGTWFNTNGYVDASIGSAYTHYVSHRAALGGIASGHTDGFDGDALVGGGANWHYHHLTFGPQASAQYTYVGIAGFNESGSLAPLQLQYNESQSLLTGLGAHVAYDWWVTKVLIRPELQLGWQHEWLDDNRSIDSKFASGAGNVFTVNSPTVGRDSLTADVSLTVKWTRHIATFITYHGDFLRQNYTEQSGSGGISVAF